MLALHKKYGKIAKVGGLIGHPDLLFIYDGDEIRKVFQREEIQPHRYRITSHVLKLTPSIPLPCVGVFLSIVALSIKLQQNICLQRYPSLSLLQFPSPSMPSLHHYKTTLRKDFFGEMAGVIGV